MKWNFPSLCVWLFSPCVTRAFLSARCSFTKGSCTSFRYQRLQSRTGTSLLPVPRSQRRWHCYPPAPRSSWLQSPSEQQCTNASMGMWGLYLGPLQWWGLVLWSLGFKHFPNRWDNTFFFFFRNQQLEVFVWHSLKEGDQRPVGSDLRDLKLVHCSNFTPDSDKSYFFFTYFLYWKMGKSHDFFREPCAGGKRRFDLNCRISKIVRTSACHNCVQPCTLFFARIWQPNFYRAWWRGFVG